MRESTDSPIYDIIRKYDRCVIDYCLMEDDAPYQGIKSHKKALEFAMLRAIERSVEDELRDKAVCGGKVTYLPYPWSFDIDKAEAAPLDGASFLFVPERLYKNDGRSSFYDYGCEWVFPNDGGKIPYWFAFLETPHGTGCTPDDFRRVNAALFPGGAGTIEVFEWTTDWSDYFDDGHEWWGAGCWSVYDRHFDRYTVLFASTTD